MSETAAAFLVATRMVLSAAFHGHVDVLDRINLDRMDPRHRAIANVMRALVARGEQVTVGTLTSECVARGADPDIARWFMGPIGADTAEQSWAAAVGAAGIEQALIRAQQRVTEGVDPWHAYDQLEAEVHELPRPVGADGPTWWTWDEVLAMRHDEQPWVLPGMLQRGERVVLTGHEGGGKSLLVYQLATGAAYGVSPLDLSRRFTPARVMVLDVENWHETQVAGHLRTFEAAYRRHVADDFNNPQIALLKARHIDLMDAGQRRVLLDAVDAFQPDLLVMGSGYKLVSVSDDWRVMATAIQRTADEARARSGCAVIIETHAGHGQGGDRNGMRPDGSSYWLRWPEFGIGMVRLERNNPRDPWLVEMRRWRGDRVTGRDWPAGWRAGGALPWTPLTAEELDYERGAA